MRVFLAAASTLCSSGNFLEKMAENNNLYILESFYYMTPFIEKLIPKFKDFLLDSGAFTFMNDKHRTMNDYNDYLDALIRFVNKNDIKHFFELDIDSVIGYEKVLDLRKKLECETGKQCIPVFHKSRGLEEYKKICENYEYISIGTIGEYNKYPEVLKKLLYIAKYNGTKVHGLGFTRLKTLHEYKFYSVDSTSWTAGSRFGYLYKFNGKDLEKISRRENSKLISNKTLLHNFSEWVKYQSYADNFMKG